MPAISKIRFTNVVYENGGKRYNDELFDFDGHNGALLLENGGGKTVFIQTAMQAIIPHIDMAERKIKDTLSLENAPAHIAVEWILNDKPRRYAVTSVSLFMENNQLNSLKYTYDYAAGDSHDIESLPFAKEQENGAKRPATRGEISEYYARMTKQSVNARTFTTIQDYGKYIENTYKIIPSEWRKVAVINSGEGNVDEFFNKCKTTEQLLNNLLIPVVEEAIEGDNSEKFVETFERQREHFKKNRILQDKIEQSRLVKEQIDAYVEVFGTYEEERVALNDAKREAKTVTNYVRGQIDNKNQEVGFNEAAQVALSREWHVYNQKALSFEWQVKNEAYLDKKKAFEHITGQLADKQQVHDQYAARKQNVELTRLSEDVKTTTAKLEDVKAQLQKVDENVEVSDIKHQLEENGAWIKGHFVYELELIHREVGTIEAALIELDQQYDKLKDDYNDASKYEKELISEKSRLSAKVELLQAEVDGLYEAMFEDEEIKSPSLLIEKIESKLNDAKKRQLAASKEKLEVSGQQDSLKQSLSTNQQQLESARHNKQSTKAEIEVYEAAKEDFVQKLERGGYHIYLTGDLYAKEESLLAELEEQKEIAYNKKERALLEERKHFNMVDLYGEMEQFSTEPLLAELVQTLKDSCAFVSTGVSHMKTVKDTQNLNEELLFERYPYWAMTIVCSVNDTESVSNAVSAMRDRLTFMVVVTTIEQISKYVDGRDSYENSQLSRVYPTNWLSNLKEDVYYDWQQSLITSAEGYRQKRKELEHVLYEQDNMLIEGRRFFETYTYDDFNELKSKLDEDDKRLKQLISVNQRLENELSESEQKYEKLSSETVSFEQTIFELNVVLESAGKLKAKDQQLMDADASLKKIEKAYVEGVGKLNGLTNALEELLKERQRLLDEKIKYEREEDKVKNLELFNEVVDFEAVGTTSSIEVLKEQRQQLKRALMGQHSGRTELESRVEQYESMLQRYQHDYDQKVREADYETEILEVYYEDEADKLFETIVEISHEMKALNRELKSKEKELNQLETRCQILKEKVDFEYHGLYQFDVETAFVENRLKIEKATLQDRERKLKKEKSQLENYIGKLKSVEQELLIKDGAYGFMSESITPLKLSVDYFEDFDEAPETIVLQLVKGLEGQNKAAKSYYDKVILKRESVIDFCKEEIHDLRLRETVVKGIHNKEDFKELLVYQEKMTEIIMKIIQVAEDDKRESDLELQTFLSHLLMYISNVSNELDMIQTKTRIQVDDVTKQIFIFDIPEWEEDEAKGALRQYVDETIEFYEKENLHDEVDESVLRKQIEERLSVKNLLQVVMGDRTIKIKCRKVTNDMKINKAPMVWESSNKWSGGEKWSKNMTLFLSILNYLAEKKQHLSAFQKRQRSVILDNPFGKASSDHVLRPVFMIADKLGFQIIALTAHAEGKFISEYFPVVYSCRLRQTTDKSKQLMTNERTLNYAYLKEHSPMTIMRMSEVEQLNLFDD